MTRVKVQTLVTLTILLIGLGGGVFVFLMLEKAPFETLAAPTTGSVQVFQTCTLTEEGVQVCRAGSREDMHPNA